MSSQEKWGSGHPVAVSRPGRLWSFLHSLVSDECQARPGSRAESGPVINAEVDMTACEHLRVLYERCRGVIEDGDSRFVIDLGAVRLADTKLVACLVAIHRAAKLASVDFEIRASDVVLEHIRVCRLDRLLERTRRAVPTAG